MDMQSLKKRPNSMGSGDICTCTESIQTAFYVSSLVTPCSSLQSRRALRSSSQADFVVTRSIRKFGNHAFALAGPAEWNKLPVFIRKSSSLPLFKTNLKTCIFKQCYD